MVIMLVLLMSVILQFAAAVLALRLIHVTGRRIAWILIAVAVFLMAVRRSITLYRLLNDDLFLPPDPTAELVALAISILLVAGIGSISPLFLALRRSTQALRHSEAQYRTLVEQASDGIFIADDQGNFLEANQSGCALLGYSRQEVLRFNIRDVILPADLGETPLAFDELRAGEPILIERRLRRKDGSLVTVEISGKMLADGRIQGIVRDITQRRRAEEEIYRRNRELAVLNQIVAASATDLEPETVLNIACRELALVLGSCVATASLKSENGGGREELAVVAEYLAENGPRKFDMTVALDYGPLHRYLARRGSPLIANEVLNDQRLASVHDLLRRRGTVSMLALPLAMDGQVQGLLTLEVGEPREFSTEEVNLAWRVANQVSAALDRVRLNQQHHQLNTAIEQTAELVIISDTDGKIVYVNPAFAQLTGYSQAEVVGQNPRLLKSGKQEPDFYEQLWETISAGLVWHGRFINKKKDGALYTVDSTITPVLGKTGAIVNYIAIQRDVTRELQLEEQYLQAHKMEAIGQLAAGIAHDFNNLLTAINGFAVLLQREIPAEASQQELLDKILHSGRRAADLVRQLLAFSRKQIIEPRVLDLNLVVTELTKMLQRIIGEHIALETDLAPHLWLVKIDVAQVEQVILNLVVNARDAMAEGGQLTIETANVVLDESHIYTHPEAQPGEYVLLAVRDTGQGMSAEVQQHLFEPFFTTKEVGRGTGLGLATVYGIVKQSGGDIWVESEEGAGSTFRIYLPRAHEARPIRPQPERRAELPSGEETILLVEDDTGVRELIREVLQGQNYSLLEARDAQEALTLAARHAGSIHLLLTDVVMPGMNGKVLADQLVKSQPQLKTLFMSGYTDDAMLQHGVQDLGIAFLQKPFSPMALAQKVRDVLDG